MYLKSINNGSLSKDIFEPRTSTGRGRFKILGSGFAQILELIVSLVSNTNW